MELCTYGTAGPALTPGSTLGTSSARRATSARAHSEDTGGFRGLRSSRCPCPTPTGTARPEGRQPDLSASQSDGLTNRRMRARASGDVGGGGATPPAPTRSWQPFTRAWQRRGRRGGGQGTGGYCTNLPAAVVRLDITHERSIQHGHQAGTINTWPAKVVADHTIRAVCTDCNSGWMRRSESAVAPLITSMIKGQPAELTVDQQLTVATWAAMKAAVSEYAWSDDTILTAADRDIIMTQDRPSASVQVRLAAIESDGSPLLARGVGYVDNSTSEKIIC
jgi:hypothetical protein